VAKKKCKVFVSYSRHDEALVRPLAGLLGVAANEAVFLDVTSLKPGELWEKKILEALREASVFILCWCCESRKSKNVTKEIAAALAEGNKKLVPVLFCAAPLPEELAKRQWTDLRGKVVHKCPVEHEKIEAGSIPPPPSPMAAPRRGTYHDSPEHPEAEQRVIIATDHNIFIDDEVVSILAARTRITGVAYDYEAESVAQRAKKYFEGLAKKEGG
jgi:hypothetical protein